MLADSVGEGLPQTGNEHRRGGGVADNDETHNGADSVDVPRFQVPVSEGSAAVAPTEDRSAHHRADLLRQARHVVPDYDREDAAGHSDLTEDFDAFYDKVVQEWQEQALCAQTDPEAFFPEKGGSTREAKRICRACGVRDECLEYALEHDERFGIWGGLSERERRRLKKRLG